MEIVLITGASSGIGRALAKLFAADGSHVVLVARREAELVELATEIDSKHRGSTTKIVMDLATPSSAEKLCEKSAQLELRINVLVNNAGFGALGRFDQLAIDQQVSMVQLSSTFSVSVSVGDMRLV